MFRNQYDTDITTYSPQGRLHQVEYAMEAVKQGSASVGVRSKTHVVLATLKRFASELSGDQKKLFAIDDHVVIAISGLTADARVLSRYMRTETQHHKFMYEEPMPVGRLVLQVADKCQISTQRASKRPFGVGLLVAGVDENGPHLYQTCPSGNYFEYLAMAIGARSQSAKTYLERTYTTLADADVEALVQAAVTALRETVTSSKDTELSAKNTAIAIVGTDGAPVRILENAAVQPYIDALDSTPSAADEDDDDEDEADAPAEAAAAAAAPDAPAATPEAGPPAAGDAPAEEPPANGAADMQT